MTDDQRLVEIEIKVSHQDVLLEELHSVIYKQQEKLDALEAKLKKLIQGIGGELGDSPVSEKPPHY